jgi:hypothetical protein
MIRSWLVRGFEGTTLIFEHKLKRGHYRGQAIERLLAALVSRDLQVYELLGACANRGSPTRNELLVVRRDQNGNLAAGQNPHYLAYAIEE